MKIEFEISSEDAKRVISALQLVVTQVTDASSKEAIVKIIDEIKTDFWLDSNTFGLVHNLLQFYTKKTITPQSDLLNQLSIDSEWIESYLNVACNNIVQQLLNLSSSPKKAPSIMAKDAKKCVTVQDIVDLINKTYGNAK